jgi:hypothetical protein
MRRNPSTLLGLAIAALALGSAPVLAAPRALAQGSAGAQPAGQSGSTGNGPAPGGTDQSGSQNPNGSQNQPGSQNGSQNPGAATGTTSQTQPSGSATTGKSGAAKSGARKASRKTTSRTRAAKRNQGPTAGFGAAASTAGSCRRLATCYRTLSRELCAPVDRSCRAVFTVPSQASGNRCSEMLEGVREMSQRFFRPAEPGYRMPAQCSPAGR